MAKHVTVTLTVKEAECLWSAADNSLYSDEDAGGLYNDDQRRIAAGYRALGKLRDAIQEAKTKPKINKTELRKNYNPFPVLGKTLCENCGKTLTNGKRRIESAIFANDGVWCKDCWNKYVDVYKMINDA